ncbi:MAG TPA: Wzz/FepE/Etk N-terminal domain-containing protein, partial [Planctomycetota bacterium]|nr:Wzz/FepE/Etk N-terminal domain-containing protein [Planctomycetota bacterium]
MADAEFTTSRGELPRSPSARSAPPTEESLELLRLVLRALARRRRLVVRIASAVLVLTALITVVSSRVYVARATIQISQDRPVLGGAPELSLFMRQVDPITSEVEILRSRSNAEEVVRRLLLRIEIESAPKGEWRFSRFEFGKLETLRARKVELELEDARRRIEESLARSDGDGAWSASRRGVRAIR